MKEAASKIQAIINTLEELEIKATHSNMDKLLGCMQVLAEIRDELMEVDNGNADTE